VESDLRAHDDDPRVPVLGLKFRFSKVCRRRNDENTATSSSGEGLLGASADNGLRSTRPPNWFWPACWRSHDHDIACGSGSRLPVDAPDGTFAAPCAPLSSVRFTWIVELPRESRISRAATFFIRDIDYTPIAHSVRALAPVDWRDPDALANRRITRDLPSCRWEAHVGKSEFDWALISFFFLQPQSGGNSRSSPSPRRVGAGTHTDEFSFSVWPALGTQEPFGPTEGTGVGGAERDGYWVGQNRRFEVRVLAARGVTRRSYVIRFWGLTLGQLSP
jgi:hypothetical protein